MSARIDLDEAARQNDFYRNVLFTGPHSQLVIMSLYPDEEIGFEVHEVDQFIYVVQGEGLCVLGSEEADLAEGDALCIAAGVAHNVVNGADGPMKLVTFYAPPEHPDHLVERSKRADA